MQQKDSGNSNLESVKGRMRKSIKSMSFQEQLVSLSKDPRFKDLVTDIRKDSTDRQEALQKQIDSMASGE